MRRPIFSAEFISAEFNGVNDDKNNLPYVTCLDHDDHKSVAGDAAKMSKNYHEFYLFLPSHVGIVHSTQLMPHYLFLF